MEDLKQAILSIMAEKLEDGLKQMEQSATNSKAEQTDEQPESSKNQQLLHDLKNNKNVELNKKCEDSILLRKELESKAAICRKQELKISQLLDVLKSQEELNLRNLQKYHKELEDKEEICYQRQHLLDKIKNQEILHLREVNELRKELEVKGNACHQLENEVIQEREMRQKLLEDLKGQTELHMGEMNDLRKELEAKDNICHQLEHQVIHVWESPEFIEMRLQLLDDLKAQDERHLREINGLRQELEANNKICSEREQELKQLVDRLHFISCSICSEPCDSTNHRLAALPCGHFFGETCVRESVQRHSTCPVCQTRASANDIRLLFASS